jgi:pimeloyl-ACP methyl ester carboxylesterase
VPPSCHYLDRGDVRLRVLDFGGTGPTVVALHGLCGTAAEWSRLAAHLEHHARLIALDLRGHGMSTRRPSSVALAECALDAAFVIESLGLGDVTLVGQSMGGRVALCVAQRRPDLVRGLALVEASPARDERIPRSIAAWLSTWPEAFDTREEAVAFFERWKLDGEAWSYNLIERDGRFFAPFDADVMRQFVADVGHHAYWDAYAAIRSPILLVRGDRGAMDARDLERMISANARTRDVEIAQAGHDVHLEQPARLAASIRTLIAR